MHQYLYFRVDVNFADVDGYTALHYACWRGNYNIAEVLLKTRKNRADTNAQYVFTHTYKYHQNFPSSK